MQELYLIHIPFQCLAQNAVLTLFFEIEPQSQAQSRGRVQVNEPGPWLGECTHIFLEILL